MVLLDTNLLLRIANTSDAQHGIAIQAVTALRDSGETLCITPQCLIEFRSAASRPTSVNGLGYAASVIEISTAEFEAEFQLLPDSADIFPAWKAIVATVGVIGKQVHDARLVAVCHAHGVDKLLTFNGAHFHRYAALAPGLAVLDPATI